MDKDVYLGVVHVRIHVCVGVWENEAGPEGSKSKSATFPPLSLFCLEFSLFFFLCSRYPLKQPTPFKYSMVYMTRNPCLKINQIKSNQMNKSNKFKQNISGCHSFHVPPPVYISYFSISLLRYLLSQPVPLTSPASSLSPSFC